MMEKVINMVEELFMGEEYPLIMRDSERNIVFANMAARDIFRFNGSPAKCYKVLHNMPQPPQSCYCRFGELAVIRVYEPSLDMVYERIGVPVHMKDGGVCSIDIFRSIGTGQPLIPRPPACFDGGPIVLACHDEPDLSVQVSLDTLTAKESEVLRLIMKGMTTSEIRRVMQISENTVNFHMKNLFLKLGANNRTHAAALGYKARLDKANDIVREMNHRVKNNLQLLSSLIEMRKNLAGDGCAREALDWVSIRIRSIAAFHELVSANHDGALVPANRFFERVAASVREVTDAPGRGIRIACAIDNAMLQMGTAIACSQIINELVTNAIAHAFAPGSGGNILVSFERIGHAEDGSETFRLAVADDGRGFAPGEESGREGSLGMSIVKRLVSQIDGRLEMRSGAGTGFAVIFRQKCETQSTPPDTRAA